MTSVYLVLIVVAFAVAKSRDSGRGPDGRELDRKEVAAIARGDQAALGRVYDRYHKLVFSLAVRVLNDQAVAEEVSQDVFLRLWHRAGDFDAARGDLVGWLATVTRNRSIDQLRSRQQREGSAWTPLPEILDTASYLATAPAVASLGTPQPVRQVFAAVPEPQRRIV